MGRNTWDADMSCKAGAKPSRTDGMICNLEAAVLTHSFKVEKDEMTPTHSIVKTTVSRDAMKQKRSFVRSPPSLKKAFEAKIEDDLVKMSEEAKETVTGKERQKYVKGKKEELRATIERRYKKQEKSSMKAEMSVASRRASNSATVSGYGHF